MGVYDQGERNSRGEKKKEKGAKGRTKGYTDEAKECFPVKKILKNTGDRVKIVVELGHGTHNLLLRLMGWAVEEKKRQKKKKGRGEGGKMQ